MKWTYYFEFWRGILNFEFWRELKFKFQNVNLVRIQFSFLKYLFWWELKFEFSKMFYWLQVVASREKVLFVGCFPELKS